MAMEKNAELESIWHLEIPQCNLLLKGILSHFWILHEKQIQYAAPNAVQQPKTTVGSSQQVESHIMGEGQAASYIMEAA